MQATAFDGIAREVGEVATRRSVFRLLGGAALSAGLVVGAGGSLAKSKSKGRDRNHAQAHGQTSAEGKKSKKVTVCYQNQTRQVKKQGWQKRYPGATLG